MTRAEKDMVIDELKGKFSENQFFYLTDSSTLTVAEVNDLRRMCFEKGVEMRVVKNKLAIKAMEALAEEKNLEPLYDALKGPTTILFTETSNVPAKIIEEYRKTHEMPVLKAAYIDSDVYLGDDELKTLASLKSKEELVGDVIMLLQSPIKNVLGSLQSGGNTISGLLKALENRTES